MEPKNLYICKNRQIFCTVSIHNFYMIMNRFIIASLLFLGAVSFTASDSFAQEFAQPYKKLEFGPFASGGLSVFQGDVPDGSKTDIHTAFTFGALGAFTFNPDWGVALGIGYESRGMYFHQESQDVPNQDFTINYLSFQPSLKFKSFLLGINIGVPMGGTALIKTSAGSSSADIPDSSLNTIIDIRAAGLLPIVENDMGNLDFYIQASYCISDAIGGSGFLTVGQTTATPVTKSPLPTLQIGLAYLFSPGGKQ
jgi:hypothetical protein